MDKEHLRVFSGVFDGFKARITRSMALPPVRILRESVVRSTEKKIQDTGRKDTGGKLQAPSSLYLATCILYPIDSTLRVRDLDGFAGTARRFVRRLDEAHAGGIPLVGRGFRDLGFSGGSDPDRIDGLRLDLLGLERSGRHRHLLFAHDGIGLFDLRCHFPLRAEAHAVDGHGIFIPVGPGRPSGRSFGMMAPLMRLVLEEIFPPVMRLAMSR